MGVPPTTGLFPSGPTLFPSDPEPLGLHATAAARSVTGRKAQCMDPRPSLPGRDYSPKQVMPVTSLLRYTSATVALQPSWAQFHDSWSAEAVLPGALMT